MSRGSVSGTWTALNTSSLPRFYFAVMLTDPFSPKTIVTELLKATRTFLDSYLPYVDGDAPLPQPALVTSFQEPQRRARGVGLSLRLGTCVSLPQPGACPLLGPGKATRADLTLMLSPGTLAWALPCGRRPRPEVPSTPACARGCPHLFLRHEDGDSSSGRSPCRSVTRRTTREGRAWLPCPARRPALGSQRPLPGSVSLTARPPQTYGPFLPLGKEPRGAEDLLASRPVSPRGPGTRWFPLSRKWSRRSHPAGHGVLGALTAPVCRSGLLRWSRRATQSASTDLLPAWSKAQLFSGGSMLNECFLEQARVLKQQRSAATTTVPSLGPPGASPQSRRGACVCWGRRKGRRGPGASSGSPAGPGRGGRAHEHTGL